MVDPAMVKLAEEILSSGIPLERGLVTSLERNDHNGEKTVIYSVEFDNDQTIHLDFVFDDSPERERAFAEILAYGAYLLMYFAKNFIQSEVDREDTLRAFQVVFNQLMSDNNSLKSLIPPDDEDINIPTVGEE